MVIEVGAFIVYRPPRWWSSDAPTGGRRARASARYEVGVAPRRASTSRTAGPARRYIRKHARLLTVRARQRIGQPGPTGMPIAYHAMNNSVQATVTTVARSGPERLTFGT